MTPLFSISIVSHAQADMVVSLLKDLDRFCAHEKFEVLLISNILEVLPFETSDFSFSVKIIENTAPKGFAENHNASFCQSLGDYFCVLNPDIRLNSNPFPSLLSLFDDVSVGLAAPLVVSPEGVIEDSARTFPTPLTILCKFFGGCHKGSYVIDQAPIFPDWVGGMFMLFPRSVFQGVGGFNQAYFLYYEDVDICARLTLSRWRVALSPSAMVVHHAQRSSRRRLNYMRWHIQSMLRFFCSRVFWRVHWQSIFRRNTKNSPLSSPQDTR